ncbi:aldehyde dehydrogenase family protein [Serratia ureilytica]
MESFKPTSMAGLTPVRPPSTRSTRRAGEPWRRWRKPARRMWIAPLRRRTGLSRAVARYDRRRARQAKLLRLADSAGAARPELARLETLDTGKIIRETQAQIAYVAEYYRENYAGLADKMEGSVLAIDKADMETRYVANRSGSGGDRYHLETASCFLRR